MVSSPISSGVVIALWPSFVGNLPHGSWSSPAFWLLQEVKEVPKAWYETKLATLYLSEPRRSSRKAGAATRITSRAAAVNPILYPRLPRSSFALLDMSSIAQGHRDCSL